MKIQEIKSPWLVQRAKFKDVKIENIVGIDSLLSMDYMGSAEFEFGGLPQSLRRMVANFNQYEVFTVNKVKDSEDNSMRIYCNKNVFEPVRENAIHLSENSYGYKEVCDMQKYIKGNKDKNNFWWDIDQDYFIFFGKDKARKVEIAMQKLKNKWS